MAITAMRPRSRRCNMDLPPGLEPGGIVSVGCDAGIPTRLLTENTGRSLSIQPLKISGFVHCSWNTRQARHGIGDLVLPARHAFGRVPQVSLEPSVGVALVALYFGAALVNGVAGIGFGLLAAAFGALLLDPRLSIVVLGAVSPLMNTQQMWLHREHAAIVRGLGPVFAGIVAGVLLGANLLVALPIPLLSIAFGAFTLWYVAVGLRDELPRVPARGSIAVGTLIGFLGGLANTVVGGSSPILAGFVLGLRPTPRGFIFAMGSLFFAMSILRVMFLAALALYDLPRLAASASLVVPALLGQAAGYQLQRRLGSHAFRTAVLTVLLAAGLLLVMRGLIDGLTVSVKAS
jgi:uncharacterized protein